MITKEDLIRAMPYAEVREFIATELHEEGAVGSDLLDIAVCAFLKTPVAMVTTDLMSALKLIPEGWWWHISHLEAVVIPTVKAPGLPVSNGVAYDEYGRPVQYSGMCWDKEHLPMAVCEAMLKAAYDLPTAFAVEASAREQAAQRIIWKKEREAVWMGQAR